MKVHVTNLLASIFKKISYVEKKIIISDNKINIAPQLAIGNVSKNSNDV